MLYDTTLYSIIIAQSDNNHNSSPVRPTKGWGSGKRERSVLLTVAITAGPGASVRERFFKTQGASERKASNRRLALAWKRPVLKLMFSKAATITFAKVIYRKVFDKGFVIIRRANIQILLKEWVIFQYNVTKNCEKDGKNTKEIPNISDRVFS